MSLRNPKGYESHSTYYSKTGRTMRYLALACDFDGTLVANGKVQEQALAALARFRSTGRKLVLVTGRRLDDLLSIFSHAELFDRIVAENGATLYRPATREEILLAEPPPAQLVQTLRDRGVQPLELGRVVIATWSPHETVALESIRDLSLDLQIIFNDGAVMLLPSGINKASGLSVALKELELSPHNIVGIGNAENDHSFLKLCECSVAVGNAIPAVRETVDFYTREAFGDGVVGVLNEIIETDLAAREPLLGRHHLLLGTRENGAEVRIRPYGASLLIAGPSGSGKSSFATAFLERLNERKYQYCVIDPEGDYMNLDNALTVGNYSAPPVDQVVRLVSDPDQNLVVNLLNVPLEDRPSYFVTLLPRLQELRAKTGRPHWIIIDEVHHLLPSSWQPADIVMSPELEGMVLITVHPNHVAPTFLKPVDAIVAVGHSPEGTISQFCDALGEKPPSLGPLTAETGEVLYWPRERRDDPFWMRVIPSRLDRRRHSRKYAEGEVSPNRSFYFRGPDGRLNLRAQNLILFMQLAEGIDDATWMYHLRRGDYARWFRRVIKDKNLADRTSSVERKTNISAHESRELIS
jgi:HAD superfamily hydrolase (TIGR01484 family)